MKQLTFTYNAIPFDWQERIDLFEDIFNVKFSNVQDGFMTALQGRPSLDIMKLDDRFGEYEGSMNNYIQHNYGQTANNIVDILI